MLNLLKLLLIKTCFNVHYVQFNYYLLITKNFTNAVFTVFTT